MWSDLNIADSAGKIAELAPNKQLTLHVLFVAELQHSENLARKTAVLAGKTADLAGKTAYKHELMRPTDAVSGSVSRLGEFDIKKQGGFCVCVFVCATQNQNRFLSVCATQNQNRFLSVCVTEEE